MRRLFMPLVPVLALLARLVRLVRLVRLAVGLSVGLGLLALGPVLTPSPAGAASEVHPEWGSTSAPDATIRKRCHGYSYSYALTPPDGDWAVETFLIGPGGKHYGSGWFVTGKDPLAGPGAFRLCRRSTKGGVYTIRALLTVQNGAAYDEGWLPETTFRLTKPRR